MSPRDRILAALSHCAGPLPVDFSSTPVTGIHVSVVAALRERYGLPRVPVKVWEPYQMLGEVDDDLAPVLHVDTVGVGARKTIFGFANEGWKEWRTPWGQEVLVPSGFQVDEFPDGSVEIYPAGDRSAPRSGRMPAGGLFFDSIIRQPPIDEDSLDVEDNLQEFAPMGEDDLAYFAAAARRIEAARVSGRPELDRAAVFNFGGTGLGDIALVPAPFEPHPRGIRDVTEWYVSTVARREYVREIFARQTEIALANLARVHAVVGETPDIAFICGTDFGTQTSQFCSVESFEELWAPFYARMNGWIHEHTTWKTFKHCCGAAEPLIESFIACGFDILNPVQITAAGMEPEVLRERYGGRIVFWGGGVDTQRTLPFGTPEEVRAEVRRNVETLGAGGGFVFNAIHNVQAKTPVENLAAMIDTIGEYRSER